MPAELRVLIVEDSADDAELIALALREGGYDVVSEVVATETAYVTALAVAPWDVILCDHNLPLFDSFKALKLLQTQGHDIPFIIVSGAIGEETAVAAMKAGAADYVMKDRLARLVPAIEREIREAAVRRDRAQAQDALQQSETWFRSLLENSYDAIAVIDTEGVFTYADPSIHRVLGYSPSTLQGTNGFGLVHPVDLEGVQTAFFELLQTSTSRTEITFRARHADGSWRWLDLRGANLLEDPRIGGVVVNFRDVTERKHAEAALHQHNERLRLLRNVAAYLLSASDAEAMVHGVFTHIQVRFGLDAFMSHLLDESENTLHLESYAGIPEGEVASLRTLELGQGISGAVALRREPILMAEIQESQNDMGHLARKLGMQAFACFPLLLDEKLFGTLAFGSRSRHRFDEEDAQFFQTIAHYVTAKYEKLHLLRELSEADRRKDLFLATLAHELRNPLAPLRNGVDLLALADDDPKLKEEALRVMDRQLQRMVRLIDDLLDVSRITRDKLELQKETVELATVIQDAVEANQPVIEEARHQLTVTLPGDQVMLEADRVRLSQVFSNLLGNAARYTPAGGAIFLTAEVTEAEVTVRVRDTGIGISQDLLPQLFQPFMQGNGHKAGLGIGLMLARRLAELHGGWVQASSDGPGKGSEFTVTLPCLRRHSEQLRPAAPVSTAAEDREDSGLRVLIVDDDGAVSWMMARLLRRQGHEVETAAEGNAALEAACRFRPHVVLLDIGLPGMDGLEVARLMRQQPEMEGTILVALSGYGQAEDIRKSHEAGLDLHLVKPASPQELARILNSVQGEKQTPA